MGKGGYYDEAEMAAILRIKVSTLRKNCSIGEGHPPFIRLGKRKLFPVDEFEKWIGKRAVVRPVA